MPTSEVIYEKDFRTSAVHLQSGTKIITDAPVDNHGKGEAFSPTDLLATSLASCMLTIIDIAGDEHGFTIEGTKAIVTKIMGTNPRRVIEIKIELFFPPNNYTDKQKQVIKYITENCPVAKSLHPDIKQNITIHY
jgi:uncharacterized OsmC-like protein